MEWLFGALFAAVALSIPKALRAMLLWTRLASSLFNLTLQEAHAQGLQPVLLDHGSLKNLGGC